jgi:hypothetical protein
MQALRLASHSALRARIDHGTMCVLRGDRLLCQSKALQAEHYSYAREQGVLYYFLANRRCMGALNLDARRGVLEIGTCKLQLRRSQDARVARRIAQHLRLAGAQQFADDLLCVL